MSKKKAKIKTAKLRNRVAQSPLLRKGGAHGPTPKALRRSEKIKLNQDVDDA